MTLYKINDTLSQAIAEKEAMLKAELEELCNALDGGEISKDQYDARAAEAHDKSNELFKDTLDLLELDRQEKLKGLICVYKNKCAYVEALKKERDNLYQRQKKKESDCEWIKEYLANNLNGEKFECTEGAVSFRKSKKVIIDDILAIPEEYLRYKEPEACKTDIKKALQDGEHIDGCHLEEGYSTSIK